MFTPEELTAIGLSLKVAVVAALASLPPGIACGWLLARRRFPGKALLDALLHLPLVMPPVVTGYALLVVLGTQGPVGSWLLEHLGIQFAFRWTGAALACAVMGFPLMVRAIRLSIEATDRRLEAAAATLGAGPGGCSSASPCRWPGRVWWPVWCWRSPRPWASSAQQSRLCPISWRNADAVVGDLWLDAGARHGIGRVAAGRRGTGDLAGRAAAVQWLVRRPHPREEV